MKEYLMRQLKKDLKWLVQLLLKVQNGVVKQHAKSILQLQDSDNRQNYLELAEILPSKLLEGEKPRLIDEWQVAPVLWDAVRTKIDNTLGYGQFILIKQEYQGLF